MPDREAYIRELVGRQAEIVGRLDQLSSVEDDWHKPLQALKAELVFAQEDFKAYIVDLNGELSPTLPVGKQHFEDAIHALEEVMESFSSGSRRDPFFETRSWDSPALTRWPKRILKAVGSLKRFPAVLGKSGAQVDSCAGLQAIGITLLAIFAERLANGGHLMHLPVLIHAQHLLRMATAQVGRGEATAAQIQRVRNAFHRELGEAAAMKRHDKTRQLAEFGGRLIHEAVVQGQKQQAALISVYDTVCAKARELGLREPQRGRFIEGPTGKNWHIRYREQRGIPIAKRRPRKNSTPTV